MLVSWSSGWRETGRVALYTVLRPVRYLQGGILVWTLVNYEVPFFDVIQIYPFDDSRKEFPCHLNAV